MDAPDVTVRRIYEPPEADAGRARVLVDRLWPRGVAKAAAGIDEWAKDAAPSTELRRWYGHEPERWPEFARRYRDELHRPPASGAVGRLLALARERPLTLVTATRDVDRSGARVLADHLREVAGRAGGCEDEGGEAPCFAHLLDLDEEPDEAGDGSPPDRPD
ncbi:MAG: DUF488 family protein [Thermoanaerobacterales bacterium]|jgi:uncharacterized protein YeaO (DUF488 family)|nr:DUF488 family protein [Thermoanaerobacterales bacterium]